MPRHTQARRTIDIPPHTTPPFVLPPFVLEILTRLEELGFQAFIIGGCVRDMLLHLEPKDWDITTNATPEQIQAIFSPTHTIITLGARYGTIGVHKQSIESAKLQSRKPQLVEITTFRQEAGYTNARHPDSIIYTQSLLDDIQRRDFTCNAIAYNPRLAHIKHTPTQQCTPTPRTKAKAQENQLHNIYASYAPFLHNGVCDSVGGIRDIKRGILRCVGEPSLRFSEDALRILRALRFCARFCFTLESNTQSALYRYASKLATISAERKQNEWNTLLYTHHLAQVIAPFASVWAVVFVEFRSELEMIANAPQAQQRLSLSMCALEQYNRTHARIKPHARTHKTARTPHATDDENLALRLCVWFYALYAATSDNTPDELSTNDTTKDQIDIKTDTSGIHTINQTHRANRFRDAALARFATRVESCLRALRYSKRIIHICTLLLPYANARPQCLQDSLYLANALESNRPAHTPSLTYMRLLHTLQTLSLPLSQTPPLPPSQTPTKTPIPTFTHTSDSRNYSPATLARYIEQIAQYKLCYTIDMLPLKGSDVLAIAQELGLKLKGEEVGSILTRALNHAIQSAPQLVSITPISQSMTLESTPHSALQPTLQKLVKRILLESIENLAQ